MLMAMVVMAVIIILNIVLLLVVMRIGTQGHLEDEVAAEQSGAVMAWRARLAAAANGDASQAAEADASDGA
jgi:uncharacterized membrane protein